MLGIRRLMGSKIGAKRRIIQVLALIISNLGFLRVLKTGFTCPFLYCYGCPFALFACPIGAIQNFIVFRQVPFFAVGSLSIYGALFGRAFCGWACPFGALHDLINHLKGGKRIKTSNRWYVKYVVLILTLTSAWITMDTLLCKLCPSGSLFAAIPFYTLNPGFQGFGTFFYVHILTLAATLILAYLISHFWCRYLCPLGAINGTFNKVSLLNIRLDEEKCAMCEVCLGVCDMGVDRVSEIGRSTDCTMCGRCVEECPEKALSFAVK
jgi:ferredoxin-type protein NapH